MYLECVTTFSIVGEGGPAGLPGGGRLGGGEASAPDMATEENVAGVRSETLLRYHCESLFVSS